jgi:hypothetical protein
MLTKSQHILVLIRRTGPPWPRTKARRPPSATTPGAESSSSHARETVPCLRSRSFVMRDLVMHWPCVLASANPLREGQRFVRPSRKDAGRHLCGLRNGVF